MNITITPPPALPLSSNNFKSIDNGKLCKIKKCEMAAYLENHLVIRNGGKLYDVTGILKGGAGSFVPIGEHITSSKNFILEILDDGTKIDILVGRQTEQTLVPFSWKTWNKKDEVVTKNGLRVVKIKKENRGDNDYPLLVEMESGAIHLCGFNGNFWSNGKPCDLDLFIKK